MNEDSEPNSKRSELALGLAFMLVAVTLTLGLGEVAVRVVSSVHLIYNIEMVKYATKLKMRDPTGEASHVHRPSASAHLMGVDISLNSLGDRGPELQNPKQPDRKRVLVMGSSITMGWGVPYDSIFTTMAERMLNTNRPFGPKITFEFVNAGIGNYNTDFQYKLFLRQYPVVKPDMVVLHYFISDVQPRGKGNDSPILRYSYFAAFLYDRWTLFKLRFGGHYTDLFTFYNGLYADTSAAWKQTQQEISSMRDMTARDRVPFVVMVIPDIHDLAPGTPYQAIYAKIDTAFRAMNIPTVNAFDAFQQQFGKDVSTLWIQSDDPHPNAKGHMLMAQLLYDYLTIKDPLNLRNTRSSSP